MTELKPYPEYRYDDHLRRNVPSKWRTTRLRNVVRLNPAVPQQLKDSPERRVPFFPMEAVAEFGVPDQSHERAVGDLLTGYSYLETDDVAFAKVTPCFENGKGIPSRSWAGESAFATTEVTVLRPQLIDPKFLSFLLQEDSFRHGAIASMTGAGGLKRVPDGYVRDFRFALPPRPEQEAIADYLDRETAEIDAFIADQERLIELLNEHFQTTVSFCITRGLDPSRRMKRTRLPWIAEAPVGWTVMKLARLDVHQESGTSVNGVGVPADVGEVGVLKTGAVSKGYFDPTENKAVIDEDLGRVSCPVQERRLIVNRANTPDLVGRAGYVEGAHTGLYLSDKLWQLDFKEADNEFIYWWTKSDVYTTQLQFHRVGASSSMQNLSFQDFVSLDIAVPPTDEQLQIAAHLRADGARIQAAIREAGEAIELSRERRSALISGAVSGTFRTL